MAKFESGVKHIQYPQSSVYAKLSDMNNMSVIREKIDDPASEEKLKNNIPPEKLEQIKSQLKSMQFDRDSISVNIPPIGDIAIQIIGREPDKCIKFGSTNSPIGFKMWIQLLPVTETSCKMRLTIDASLNMFIKAMVEKPLKEGVDKLADMLAMIPYE